MTIHNAIQLFEKLLSETSNKSEIKNYEKFIYILNALKSKTFTANEMQAIETELVRLNLESNPDNKRKFFKKRLSEFEGYLKETCSMVSKGYYTSLGMGLGSSFGIVFGVVFLSRIERSLGITFGIIIGMVVGLLIGRYLDNQADSENKVL